MSNFFTTGVRWRDPRLTRSPRLWWAYLCWCLHFQMTRIGFWEPLWLTRWRIRRGDRMGRRKVGALYRPWWRLTIWVGQQTMRLSHRCEFTDPESGALYTGRPDAFMERAFNQFLRNISRD